MIILMLENVIIAIKSELNDLNDIAHSKRVLRFMFNCKLELRLLCECEYEYECK